MMKPESRQILEKMRAFILGEAGGDFPLGEELCQLEEADPDFRVACEQDEIIQGYFTRQAERTRKGHALAILRDRVIVDSLLFDQPHLKNAILQDKKLINLLLNCPLSEEDLQYLEYAYQTFPEFRARCEKYGIVYENADSWKHEREKSQRRLLQEIHSHRNFQ